MFLCSQCSRELPSEAFRHPPKVGCRNVPRQCLDCKRKWNRENEERKRRAAGCPVKNDPARKAESRARQRARSLEHIKKWVVVNRSKSLKLRKAAWERFYARNPGAYEAALAKGRLNRKFGMKKRTPSWGQEGIADVYLEAKYFHMEVDHIVPLQGRKVSGLHVWDNLQLLPKSVNRAKRNSFDPATFQG